MDFIFLSIVDCSLHLDVMWRGFVFLLPRHCLAFPRCAILFWSFLHLLDRNYVVYL